MGYARHQRQLVVCAGWLPYHPCLLQVEGGPSRRYPTAHGRAVREQTARVPLAAGVPPRAPGAKLTEVERRADHARHMFE